MGLMSIRAGLKKSYLFNDQGAGTTFIYTAQYDNQTLPLLPEKYCHPARSRHPLPCIGQPAGYSIPSLFCIIDRHVAESAGAPVSEMGIAKSDRHSSKYFDYGPINSRHII